MQWPLRHQLRLPPPRGKGGNRRHCRLSSCRSAGFRTRPARREERFSGPPFGRAGAGNAWEPVTLKKSRGMRAEARSVPTVWSIYHKNGKFQWFTRPTVNNVDAYCGASLTAAADCRQFSGISCLHAVSRPRPVRTRNISRTCRARLRSPWRPLGHPSWR